ncbi:MAG TPA: M28 family peptidase, partial [Chitinophagaceae bacterium]|nr:M28 family peptidase [Chitinophagaceae bacterium]
MKTLLVTGLLVSIAPFLLAQEIDAIINAKEVERIEKVLASDDMRGRKAFSPDIEKAADFIAAEFKAAGLKTWDNGNSFRQGFALASMKQLSLSATFDGSNVDPQRIVFVTAEPEVIIDQASGYSTGRVKAGDDLFTEATGFAGASKNMIILIDSSYAKNFPRLSFFKNNRFKSDKNIVFILGSELPEKFRISATHEVKEQKAANVVGILPGKTKKDEFVIFSGHYDHLGVGKPVNGDSIFNGANDDA